MCDTAVVLRPGRVLFAKNSDRDPNEPQVLEWHPARVHPGAERLRCTHIHIDQVWRTHAILISRPFWMWGAEMGANEHGVVIGNEAVFTNRPYAARGLTGMDLLRLGLERGANAEQAVEVITRLLEQYGQGGGCGLENPKFTYHNSFLVADSREAYVLETAARQWEVERVSDGPRTISNALSIASFVARHAERIKTRVARGYERQARTTRLAAQVESAADMARLLRDHGPDLPEPAYTAASGALGAPCVHGGGLLAGSQTVQSWITELTNDGVRHWVTGTAAPCTGLFKPVRVDRPLALEGDPTDKADEVSLWWRHERLHRRVLTDPTRLLALYAAERDEVEADWFEAPPDPRQAFDEGDRLLTRWTRRVAEAAGADTRPQVAQRYWAKRNKMAGF